jgi:hypothetical protein
MLFNISVLVFRFCATYNFRCLRGAQFFWLNGSFVTAASRPHNMYTHVVACVGSRCTNSSSVLEPIVIVPSEFLPLRGRCDVMNHKFPEVLYTCVITNGVEWWSWTVIPIATSRCSACQWCRTCCKVSTCQWHSGQEAVEIGTLWCSSPTQTRRFLQPDAELSKVEVFHCGSYVLCEFFITTTVDVRILLQNHTLLLPYHSVL